ncbi:hypothetical protein pqer_cds_644 [Pandoravirus quercus]|uniref:Uncharacterized protein n=1 Tax=Pandoravirus quercus TaxID=2107709 RepID=A0A2U7U9F8_9VIRU|nr:hypothetical protein pqer_cds_644 [Pandoravirus quercus]AVK75066.1 hypothetical protein pqer_cds_644 [Pandoravirus quercus]
MNSNQPTSTLETATASNGSSQKPEEVDTSCESCKVFAAQWNLTANDICVANAPTASGAASTSTTVKPSSSSSSSSSSC